MPVPFALDTPHINRLLSELSRAMSKQISKKIDEEVKKVLAKKAPTKKKKK